MKGPKVTILCIDHIHTTYSSSWDTFAAANGDFMNHVLFGQKSLAPTCGNALFLPWIFQQKKTHTHQEAYNRF